MRINIFISVAWIFLLMNSPQAHAIDRYYHCDVARDVISDCAKQLKKEERLSIDGSGGGFVDGVNKLDFSFISREKLNVCEARKLFLRVVEKILSKVNANKTIRPYLHHYPYRIEDLDIMLAFDDCHGNAYEDGFVALMYVAKCKLFFKGRDKGKFYDLYVETVEEALKNVQTEECAISETQEKKLPALKPAPQ